MKLLQKITSLIVTATMVMGLGSSLLAAPKSVKIDAKHFPDPGFRNYVSRKFDKNHNGTLSVGEIENALYISIEEEDNVESLQGIRYICFVKEIHVSDTCLKDEELDLFDMFNLTKIMFINVKGLKTLTPGLLTTYLEIDFCESIRTLNLEDTDYLTNLTLIRNQKLRGNVDASVSTYLKNVMIDTCPLDSITINKKAKLDMCYVTDNIKVIKK